LNPFT